MRNWRVPALVSLAMTIGCFGWCGGCFGCGAPSQPDTVDGLKQLGDGVYAALKAGDKGKAEKLISSMKLPDPPAFFKKVFGDEIGKKLADDYAQQVGEFDAQLMKIFQTCVDKGQSDMRVLKFAKPGDSKATGLQNEALAGMKNPVALYSLRMVKPDEDLGMHLWSFVHVNGAFRLAGKMNGVK